MRSILLALSLGLAAVGTASAEVSVGIQLPGVSIGINVPLYPQLVAVPGYPVYYAPGIDGNFFFYDGLYWVYDDDRWYASSWYNGPWRFVEPGFVPLYVLRVPVRYYRRPPPYFGGWRRDAPPRWGEHWGHDWEAQHHGWDRWNRGAVPQRAPLPNYQRQYSGEHYPRGDEQRSLHTQHYRYEPRDRVVREQFRGEAARPEAGRNDRGHGNAPPGRNDRPPRAERAPDAARADRPRQAPSAEPQRHNAGDRPAPSPRSQPQDRREPERRAPAEPPRERRAEPAAGGPHGERERPRAEPPHGREPPGRGEHGGERPPEDRGR